MSDALPALERLIGGYLHQDWAVDFESESDAIATFRNDAEPADVRAAVMEIEKLLASGDSDDALRERMYALGLATEPTGADGTVHSWLRKLASDLQ